MINIELGHYLTLGGVIFLLGVVGIFLNRKNIIVILMSVELILLSVNINLVAFSTYSGNARGPNFLLDHPYAAGSGADPVRRLQPGGRGAAALAVRL